MSRVDHLTAREGVWGAHGGGTGGEDVRVRDRGADVRELPAAVLDLRCEGCREVLLDLYVNLVLDLPFDLGLDLSADLLSAGTKWSAMCTKTGKEREGKDEYRSVSAAWCLTSFLNMSFIVATRTSWPVSWARS